MTLIRLSCIGTNLYAPMANGRFVGQPYSPATRYGFLEQVSPQGPLPGFQGNLHLYLGEMLAEAPQGGAPLLVMVHGYDFRADAPLRSDDPQASDNAHSRIYHFTDHGDEEHDRHSTGWPLWLGFEETDQGGNGIAIAFAWNSFGDDLHLPVYELAEKEIAWSLLGVLLVLHARRPNRRIDLFGHSLGTHVILQTLRLAAEHAPDVAAHCDRVILMGGSAYVTPATQVYDVLTSTMPPSLGAPLTDALQIYNFMSVEDAVVGPLSEIFTRGPNDEKHMIGRYGLKSRQPRDGWLDLELEDDDLKTWVRDNFALDISGDQPGFLRSQDHWYYWTHRPNMALYRKILRDRDETSIAAWRGRGVPEHLDGG
ncbi:MAG: alpha/beta hydrolase [Alphaproteobacteria bacterium]|nr:alpha/beta hydrolase [Alphaproteobacteria bacterium]